MMQVPVPQHRESSLMCTPYVSVTQLVRPQHRIVFNVVASVLTIVMQRDTLMMGHHFQSTFEQCTRRTRDCA